MGVLTGVKRSGQQGKYNEGDGNPYAPNGSKLCRLPFQRP
jgi:hypothetical protein